ncbi:hypothetical protein LIER_38654 [Lithospermum erythrorhizon]|uniref:DUF3168 domain-containing protein n=1 Tax=Lithospermum erythrorhizon TaxID=34254 RepID=A0AAV3Q5F5_LITER
MATIDREIISFSKEELEGIEVPHDDPLIISPVIANFLVTRMLVDRLGLPRNLLKPACTPLIGYTGYSIYPVGITELDFIVGEAPRTSTIRASFIVVDISDPSYNRLIGRAILTALRAIVSPLHLKMKFPTIGGVGEVSGDQKRSRVYYQLSIPRGTSLRDPPK